MSKIIAFAGSTRTASYNKMLVRVAANEVTNAEGKITLPSDPDQQPSVVHSRPEHGRQAGLRRKRKMSSNQANHFPARRLTLGEPKRCRNT